MATYFWKIGVLIWVGMMTMAAVGVAAGVGPMDGHTRKSRPDPDGTPTRVQVGVYFVDLIAIDDRKQEFTADVFLRLHWRDERLALEDAQEPSEERVFPVTEIWTPELASLNRRDVKTLLPEVARVDAVGRVTYEQRAYGTFGARLDLRRFPADTQELRARIVSYRYTSDELQLELDPASGLMPDPSVAGWRIEAAEPVLEPLIVPGAVRDFAGLTFTLTATRETAHYLLTVAFPLLLIAAMAWSVFWIDPQFLPSQIAVSTASVFTLIAFRFSIKLSLPNVSYLTEADKFLLAVTFLVFGALGHAIGTGRMAKTGREEAARTADRWARWIYLIALLGITLYAVG